MTTRDGFRSGATDITGKKAIPRPTVRASPRKPSHMKLSIKRRHSGQELEL